MTKQYFSILFLILISILSCKKAEKFGDNPFIFESTKIVAHKGGPHYPFGNFQDNTLEACKYGLANTDGIEIDIQMSRDKTIWLFHDEYFSDCNTKKYDRISGCTDREIEEYVDCMGINYSLTRLESVFRYISDNKIEKTIHLDVKPWLPTRYSNTLLYLLDEADEIIALAKKYDLEKYCLVECENATFLTRIKRNSNMETYLATYCDVENGIRKALKFGYNGISHNFNCAKLTSSMVELAHEKGLQIQVWTINDKADIQRATDMKVDYIQTDNLN